MRAERSSARASFGGVSARALLALAAAALLLAACGATSPWPDDAFLVGSTRTAVVVPPPGADPSVPRPLIVALHGYRSSPENLEATFPLASGAAVAGAYVAWPQGVIDTLGFRFWDASEACCNLFGFAPDDEGYLLEVIDEIQATVAVSEVVLFGHSNGGFMAYALACRHPERFAGVITIAGALDVPPPPECGVGGPASVLHIHGTADRIVDFDGGRLLYNLGPRDPYTSAFETADTFAMAAGCSGFVFDERFDLDAEVPGAETAAFEFACPEGRRVALWRVEDGDHDPGVRLDFAARLLNFIEGR